jgi:hypothetical protein
MLIFILFTLALLLLCYLMKGISKAIWQFQETTYSLHIFQSGYKASYAIAF